MSYNPHEAEKQFIEFLAENGFDINALKLVVGKEGRCRVEGDKSKRESGRFRLYLDAKANGWCINHLTGGEYVKWRYQFTEEERRQWYLEQKKVNKMKEVLSKDNISKEEKQKLLDQLKKEDEDRKERTRLRLENDKLQRERDEVRAQEIFEEVCDQIEFEIYNYTLDCLEHEYLDIKGIKAHDGLKVIYKTFQAEDLIDEDSEPLTYREGDLLIELFNIDERVVSFQTIDKTGRFKKFRINGRKFESFHIVGADSLSDIEEFHYSEGYATSASIYEFYGKPVICCLDVGNLQAVHKLLKEKYPDKLHIVWSDNDYFKYLRKLYEGDSKAKNVGLEAAVKIYEEYGTMYLFPIFPKNDSSSDWNDLASLYGNQKALFQADYQLNYFKNNKKSVLNDENIMKSLVFKLYD